MDSSKKQKLLRRRRRRVRGKAFGTPEHPRLSVRRSLRHIYCQVVDDTTGTTLASASTVVPELRKKLAKTGDCEAAAAVGTLIAEHAVAVGVKTVMFDRGGRKFHGRIKALAEAARKSGLKF
ncbi:MAG: 50S ribosomal protein L18 [Planctomycetia bacterium]|nr:50S ribosomal protein L18 [Planctomycetia bacterium]